MIRAAIRFLCLAIALGVALLFLLPATLLAVAFYILAAIFDGRHTLNHYR